MFQHLDMTPNEIRDAINTRINNLLDRYARILPIYNQLVIILFTPFSVARDSELDELIQKLQQVEDVLKSEESTDSKTEELKKIK
jgi:hypothetical protein